MLPHKLCGSTNSREIQRNRTVLQGYSNLWYCRPHAAQRRADARRPRPRTGKIAGNPRLRDYIRDRLERRWSPEQIANQSRRDFFDDLEMHVIHETIYQALYVQGRGELRRGLTRCLRTGRARRKHHRQTTSRRKRFAVPMILINERPAKANDPTEPGH